MHSPYNTRSEPLAADGGSQKAKKKKASALISRSSVERARSHFERFIGLTLLAGSGAGNYLAFNAGGFTPADILAFIAAIAALSLLTALQWFYRPDIGRDVWWFEKIMYWCMGLTWKYCASVIIGVGLTVYGAQTIALPVFERVLSGWVAADILSFVSWLLLIVVSLVVEVIPENILVD